MIKASWISDLMFLCLFFSPLQISFENLAPQVSRQICKEVHGLVSDPPEGIKVILNEEDISDIQAIIDGPGESDFVHLFVFSF